MPQNALAFMRRLGPSGEFIGPRTAIDMPIRGVFTTPGNIWLQLYAQHNGWFDSATFAAVVDVASDPANYVKFAVYNMGKSLDKSILMTEDSVANTSISANGGLDVKAMKSCNLTVNKDERIRRVELGDIIRCRLLITGTLSPGVIHPHFTLRFT